MEPRPYEAEGLLLRLWTDDDAGQVARVAADPEIVRWNPMRPLDPLEWCRHRADWSSGEHASWAVVEPATPQTVRGSVSLWGIDAGQQLCEVGFWVSPGSRRRGIGSRALRAASAFGFGELGLHRIVLFHAVDNPGSCGVATHAGFAHEGTHRASYRYGDGSRHDEHSHARLTTDTT